MKTGDMVVLGVVGAAVVGLAAYSMRGPTPSDIAASAQKVIAETVQRPASSPLPRPKTDLATLAANTAKQATSLFSTSKDLFGGVRSLFG